MHLRLVHKCLVVGIVFVKCIPWTLANANSDQWRDIEHDPIRDYRIVQQELQSCLKTSVNPNVFLRVDDNTLSPLLRLYAGIESKRREICDESIDLAIVESCFQLYESTLEHVAIGNNAYYTPLTILRHYTFNHTSSLQEIQEWWQRSKTQTRDEWARASVDRIMKSAQWDGRSMYSIQESTMNYRVYVMTKEEFAEWWNVWRGRSPREWALDTLEWALKQLGTGSSEVPFAYIAATRLLPEDKVKALEDHQELGPKLKESGERLFEWLRKQDRYDPLSPRRSGCGLDSIL